MAKRWVVLTFTPQTSPDPIIYNLGQQFPVVTNIHQADATEDKGWIVVELEGKEDDIEAGIAWAISKGVRVDSVSDKVPGG